MVRKKKDELAWVGPTVQFVFGAIVGGLVGVGVYAEFLTEAWGWVCIPFCALGLGVLAAVFGDDLWEYWFGGRRY